MIFQFHTDNVTFFEEDKAYFEKRFLPLKKFAGISDDDSVMVTIKVAKNKHSSGNRFEASANMDFPGLGKFHTETTADNIRKCGDLLTNVLKSQIRKSRDKQIG